MKIVLQGKDESEKIYFSRGRRVRIMNIVDDDFAYSQYENRASKEECRAGLLPKVAELRS